MCVEEILIESAENRKGSDITPKEFLHSPKSPFFSRVGGELQSACTKSVTKKNRSYTNYIMWGKGSIPKRKKKKGSCFGCGASGLSLAEQGVVGVWLGL